MSGTLIFGRLAMGWFVSTASIPGCWRKAGPNTARQIVAAVGRQFEQGFGRGFGDKNLRRIVQLAQAFPEARVVAALWRSLGWTHFKVLIPLQRRSETFLLHQNVSRGGLEHEDRYVLDLLGLRDTYSEDLEPGLLREIERFLLELATGSRTAYGQTQRYLRWLNRHEQKPGEDPPIKLTLCAGKPDE